ncbi:hypothetical protein VNO77_22505 [Canavalia gladiata]|uniref:Uncharacterized protein n=1 Tax=Canavalia gladiata TaxID=3824 RepID=A0AAN9Q825_CANGL
MGNPMRLYWKVMQPWPSFNRMDTQSSFRCQTIRSQFYLSNMCMADFDDSGLDVIAPLFLTTESLGILSAAFGLVRVNGLMQFVQNNIETHFLHYGLGFKGLLTLKTEHPQGCKSPITEPVIRQTLNHHLVPDQDDRISRLFPTKGEWDEIIP